MSDDPKPNPRLDPEDAIGISGLVLVTVGAWMAWHPAAPMLAGMMLFFYAWVRSRPKPPGTV